MKHLFPLITILLMACTSQSSEMDAIGKIGNANILPGYEFKNDDDYSLACNICLIDDTLQKVNRLIELRDSFKLIDGKYEKKKATFSEIKDLVRLKMDIGKELMSYMDKFGTFRSADIRGNSMNIFKAREECIANYGYFNIKDPGKRDTLFLTYDLYRLEHVNLPIYNGPVDTSEIPRTPSGDFITLHRGDTLIIAQNKYTRYFENILEKYTEAWNHVYEVRTQIITELTGMDPSQMSAMQKMIFDIQRSETRGRIHIFHPIQPDLKLQQLRDTLDQSFYE